MSGCDVFLLNLWPDWLKEPFICGLLAIGRCPLRLLRFILSSPPYFCAFKADCMSLLLELLPTRSGSASRDRISVGFLSWRFTTKAFSFFISYNSSSSVR